MQWALNASKKLREKSTGFKDGKKGLDIIRNSRNREL